MNYVDRYSRACECRKTILRDTLSTFYVRLKIKKQKEEVRRLSYWDNSNKPIIILYYKWFHWNYHDEYPNSFATISILFLALSLTVWPTFFIQKFFIMMFRCNTSKELRNYEKNWGRNAPFSSRQIFRNLETKHYNMVTLVPTPTDTLWIFWQQQLQPKTYR